MTALIFLYISIIFYVFQVYHLRFLLILITRSIVVYQKASIVADYCWMNYKELEALVISCPCRNNLVVWRWIQWTKKEHIFVQYSGRVRANESERDGKWILLHLRASFTQSLKHGPSQGLLIDKKQAPKWAKNDPLFHFLPL